MSGKVKPRPQANVADDLTMSINEKIMKDVHALYSDPENGLISIGNSVGVALLPPRKKATVMVMGNHSAGKSSFINWYIEEHIQKTGVAIETQGFHIVTSGKKRESLTGAATLQLIPRLKNLQELEGVVDYLYTEVSTSKQKKFPLINFLDTPGLVDGDMNYPFDVNKTMEILGEHCDLIFVFFDPIGQALCKRTLDIVEKLNQEHPDRIRFFLTKADESGHESDRARVQMQIVQELCKRTGLNKIGFEMPTIYIPILNKQTRCINQIDRTSYEIERTINITIQETLEQMNKDCNKIETLIDNALRTDALARAHNKKAKLRAMGLSLVGFLLPVFLIFQLLVASAPREALIGVVGENMAETIVYLMTPCTAFWKRLGSENELMVLTVFLITSAFCLVMSRLFGKTNPTLQKKSSKALMEKKDLINERFRPSYEKFFKNYISQCVSEDEL